MSYQKESFGMMDEGYFVPRGQLIDWINQLLDLSITKIQQLGAGSIYCQIVDVIHPGKVAISKVNWRAKNDYQFINNLKILQTAFQKAGVKRYVEVQKLAKAKYQDNLEFIQWLKRYYDLNCGDRGKDYNAKQRRGNCAVDLSFADKNIVPKTYNSSGQIVSKSQIPAKKTNPIVGNKSGIVQTKPQPPKVERRPQIKQSIKIEQPIPSSKIEKKKQESKQQGSKNNGENSQSLYKEKNKQLSLKIGMIEQVLRSDQSSDLKIAMLEEILAITRNKQKTFDIEIQATYQASEQNDHQNNMISEEDEII